MIDDLTVVHRYDQRGVGGSAWEGHHTLERHLQDLDDLLDGWGHARVTVVGHSYGTDLAARYCLRRPDRAAGLVLLSGPFLGSWRDLDRNARDARMTDAQRRRVAELDAVEDKTAGQEEELLTLSWFTDHYDRGNAWFWASQAARRRRPINWEMSRQISVARHADPLDDRLDELTTAIPASTVLIGGAGDPRPAAVLVQLGARLNRPAVIIPDAGHEPWLEAPDLFATEFRKAILMATPDEG